MIISDFYKSNQIKKMSEGEERGESLQTQISDLDGRNDAICLLYHLQPSDSKLGSAFPMAEHASKEAVLGFQAPRQSVLISLAPQSYSNAFTLKYADENSTKQPAPANTSSSVKCIC